MSKNPPSKSTKPDLRPRSKSSRKAPADGMEEARKFIEFAVSKGIVPPVDDGRNGGTPPGVPFDPSAALNELGLFWLNGSSS